MEENFKKKVEKTDAALFIGKNFDSVKREFLYGGSVPSVYYYINGFGNGELSERLLSFMMRNKENVDTLLRDPEEFQKIAIPYAEVSQEHDFEKMLHALYSGNAVVMIEHFPAYFIVDTRRYPTRSIEEPSKDKVLRGSRDGFTEALVPNSAMIRRRIRDHRLIFEKITVGESTGTDVLLCYMDHLADKSYIAQVMKAIKNLKVKGLNMGQESLAELLIQKKWYNPFPKIRYTERPDAAAAMLMEGSVIVLCDNYPAAMILPTSIFDFMQDTDDFYFTPTVGLYLKIVRNIVFVLSFLFIPIWYAIFRTGTALPTWLSFLSYHGNCPVPLLFQILLVEIAIDGLKLASLNTPEALANSLSVISALILGEFAIKVGWLSEEVILYMAFVAIANFTQPSYELGYAFKFMRMLTLVLIAFMGYWGLGLGLLFTLFLIATNNTVGGGKGYLFPLIPFNLLALKRLFFRYKAEHSDSHKNSQNEN